MGAFDFITDAFTGRPAKEAAEKQRGYLQGVQNTGNAAIDTGLGSSLGYIGSGADAARAALAGGYGTSTGAINTGADAALSNLGQGTQGALGQLGAASSPLSALAAKYGGATALGLGALGVNGQAGTDAARAAFESSPGYQFQLDQGLEAINRARNARGMLNSGNTDRDAQIYGQGLAKQDYQTWLNNLLGFTNPELSATSGASNITAQGAGILNQGGINRANVESNRGAMLSDLAQRYGMGVAGIDTNTGQSLANLATGAAGQKVNLGTAISSPYLQTYGQEAAAQQQGSANLWNLGLSAATLGAGRLPGLGSNSTSVANAFKPGTVFGQGTAGAWRNPDLRGYAYGGRPDVGVPAIVGEQGPEVFVPDQPGTVVPMQQMAAMAPKRGTPEFGGADVERAAGIGMTARGGSLIGGKSTRSDLAGEGPQAPSHLETALSDYARGNLTAKDVQRIFKQNGWQVDLRRGRYDFEAFDPSGRAYYITP